ncbi:MAG: transposase [Deltaproteobacteria bacterium]|nr:transposase [Deltaproteobacteria bacterium]MBW2022114.1 transposase [Deltaproteobacteria bacterium]MBW2045232.1 transposase [Deltaproteobacteria bacterium]MBW2300212.1 transposase [Deltaproteobacteria bacterium]
MDGKVVGQNGTENERVIKDFLNSLIDGGLNVEGRLLCVIDGSKGLYSGIKKVFRDKVLIQRCQWHKMENVVSYLHKECKIHGEGSFRGPMRSRNMRRPRLS